MMTALMYAEENDGYVFLHRDWTSGLGELPWWNPLYESGLFDDPNMALCPSWEPTEYDPENDPWAYMKCYGAEVGLWIAGEYEVSNVGGVYSRKLQEIDSPSTRIFIADSTYGGGAQMYIIMPAAGYTVGVHLRHSDRANTACYDGHVESATPDFLLTTGFTMEYDLDCALIAF